MIGAASADARLVLSLKVLVILMEAAHEYTD
jgi:hypothetical protein